jgi:hypothetical protein
MVCFFLVKEDVKMPIEERKERVHDQLINFFICFVFSQEENEERARPLPICHVVLTVRGEIDKLSRMRNMISQCCHLSPTCVSLRAVILVVFFINRFWFSCSIFMDMVWENSSILGERDW